MNSPQPFIVFPLGNRNYAIAAAKVSEVTLPQVVDTFPHTSEEILGVMVRRGRVIPVYDFAGMVGLQRDLSQQFHLIAIRGFSNGTELAALPVSGECNLISAEMFPSRQSRPGICGELKWRDKSYEVLDLDKLFPAESQQ